jgi:hypothetical protein
MLTTMLQRDKKKGIFEIVIATCDANSVRHAIATDVRKTSLRIRAD